LHIGDVSIDPQLTESIEELVRRPVRARGWVPPGPIERHVAVRVATGPAPHIRG
jgi:hypothetical protein